MNTVLDDNNQPLYVDLNSAIIHRSGRMRLPYSATKRHKSSFIHLCIKLYNNVFNS